MGIIIGRGSLRDAPNRAYIEKSILLDVMHVDPQAQVHLRAGSADHDGSAASTSEACKRQHYARPGRVSFGERSTKLSILAAEGFGRLGVEGTNFIDQFATGVVGGSGGSMTNKWSRAQAGSGYRKQLDLVHRFPLFQFFFSFGMLIIDRR